MEKREQLRSSRRSQRRQEQQETLCTMNEASVCVISVLHTVRSALTDVSFLTLLRAHGVASIPTPLVETAIPVQREISYLTDSKDYLDDVSLDFVVAWKFFFPLFTNSVISTHLEQMWPGFIAEMKDTFIRLVVDGPFPHAMSGYRGRRRD
jgi:hypothetical protein